ncbi:MAG: hypothetical protein PHH75_04685 [Candidatus Omnitrophica bacterium]|nr:hypothetical protein [Candidatus Omnitrophota bacterium]MDD5574457.1 hypothetical protein [Candidatus Omnitrophota bacterium]
MTKTSSSFRHKAWRRFLLVFLGLVVFWASANAALTVVLHVQLSALKSLFASEALKLDYAGAFINIFQGATVKNLSCHDDQGLLWRVKRLDVGFNISSLSKGKIEVKNLTFAQSRVEPGCLLACSGGLRRIVSRMDTNVGFFDTTYFDCDELWLGDAAAVAFHGYLSSLQGGLYVSKGEVALKSVPFLEDREQGVLKTAALAEPFDYLLDVEAAGNTWKIVRFELTNTVLHGLGSGKIFEAASDRPRADFTLSIPHLILDDLPLMNSDSLQTRGLAEFVFSAAGPLEQLKKKAALKIVNADVEVFGSFSVRKLNGTLTYENDAISSSRLDLFINQVPFQADFSVACLDVPTLIFNAASVPKGGGPSDFTLQFDGHWTKAGQLRGDLSGTWRYLFQDLAHDLTVAFKGFGAGFDEDLFVASESMCLSLNVTSQQGQALKKEVFRRTFVLEDLFAIVRRQKDGFSLDPMKAGCYGGTLEGRLFVYSAPETFGADAEAHLRDVDLHAFAEQAAGETSLIVGRLDGDVKLDTRIKDVFRGQLFVTNGVIEQNSLLDAVADFLGVASLKKLSFRDLSVFFNGGRGDYSSKVTLTSDDVSALLEGNVCAYDTMDGYLSVVIATSRLNESRQFKKLLAYIKHDQPSVTFPFKISSYLESPRVLWLKNEFKDKLTTLLPERNKRYLQKQVNSMVEGIKTE